MADQDRHVISQAFETVTGTQLIAMKKEDFVGILGNNGDFMYQTFRTMYLAVPNLDGKGQADPRSLTPISEKTDSDSSPEPDPDPRHCPGPPTESSQHLERRGGGNGNSLKTDSCDR
ncbi:uncharacterized protein LOC124289657 isoform X2 [Haliotis rubra]|nr:uncharacterized protein LOC124289657 isoform X2 [Haliotis rubra]XP_046582220.1 uncharacterized protein LOC124289657 isoform X2 [Haliotis rubra]